MRHDSRERLAHVLLLAFSAVCLVGGFLGGRAYERRYWAIASPAKRQMWGAKEGAFAERMAHAQKAIHLDPEYLPAYYWKARAVVETSPEATADDYRQSIAILSEGFTQSSAAEALTWLAYCEEELGRDEEARAFRQVA